MQNLKELNNSELVSRTKTLVLKERETTNEILWCLRTIQQRMVYAEYSCSSLFEFCVKHLGYSGGAASRRIRAMEFLKEVPETEKALKEGKVSLTTVASLQSYLQHEKKKRRENKEEQVTLEAKKDLLHQIENKSKTECEKIFVSLSPSLEDKILGTEKARVLTPDKTELKLVVEEKLMQNIQRLRELSAHKNPNLSYAEIFLMSTEFMLEKIDPQRQEEKRAQKQVKEQGKKQKEKNKSTQSNQNKVTDSSPENLAVQNSVTPLENQATSTLSTPQSASPDPHFVSAKTRRDTLHHADWQCEHVDEKTGLRCTSRWALEIDHCQPVALGGSSSPENLRCLCRTHNAYAAVKIFGREKMGDFLPQTK